MSRKARRPKSLTEAETSSKSLQCWGVSGSQLSCHMPRGLSAGKVPQESPCLPASQLLEEHSSAKKFESSAFFM